MRVQAVGIYWRRDLAEEQRWSHLVGRAYQYKLSQRLAEGQSILDAGQPTTTLDEQAPLHADDGPGGANFIFCDHAAQRALYVLYNDFKIVYVGQSGGKKKARLLVRLKDHTRDRLAERWDRFSFFGLTPLAIDATKKVSWQGVAIDYGTHATLAIDQEPPKTDFTEILDNLESVLLESLEGTLNRKGGMFRGERYFGQFKGERLGG